ncbi:MAG: hypothetical protein PVH61_21345 [Candidatus Aminicenantes bacterium]|jgi:hypothetical protein
MNASRNLAEDYYFVPLGREPGSYLDVLGLPPTASEVEAKNRQEEYLLGLIKDFKNKRKKLRERKEKKEITEEEFNAQVKEWKEEKRKKEVDLNKKEENYDLSLAEERKLKNMGFVDDNVIWLDMYKSLSSSTDSEYLKELFFKKRPLPEIEQSLLDIVRSPGDYRPSSFEKYRKIKLKKFQNFLDEMNLSFLLKADDLWSNLKYTNLGYWLNKIEKWGRELDLIFPRLDRRRLRVSNFAEKPDFPTICEPFNLAIESLHSEEMEDISIMPERKGDKKEIGLAVLLAEMLARESMMDMEKPESADFWKNKKKMIPFADFITEFFEILSNTKDDI